MAEGASKGGSIVWTHTDTRGIVAATQAAYARARKRDWSRDEASVQDQRALVLYALMASVALSPSPPVEQNGTLVVATGPRAPTPEGQDWQTALVWGVVYLLGVTKQDVDAGRMTLTVRVRVETENGYLPSGPTEDAGFPFLGAIAIVTAATALAGVLALWFSQRNEIDATKIAADERVQKHAAALAEASSVVDAHLQAEQTAGQSLPWDTAQLSYLETLKDSIRELAKTPSAPLQSVPDLGAISGGVAQGAKDAGAGVKNLATGAGVGLGTAPTLILLYLLLKDDGAHRRAAA